MIEFYYSDGVFWVFCSHWDLSAITYRRRSTEMSVANTILWKQKNMKNLHYPHLKIHDRRLIALLLHHVSHRKSIVTARISEPFYRLPFWFELGKYIAELKCFDRRFCNITAFGGAHEYVRPLPMNMFDLRPQKLQFVFKYFTTVYKITGISEVDIHIFSSDMSSGTTEAFLFWRWCIVIALRAEKLTL